MDLAKAVGESVRFAGSRRWINAGGATAGTDAQNAAYGAVYDQFGEWSGVWCREHGEPFGGPPLIRLRVGDPRPDPRPPRRVPDCFGFDCEEPATLVLRSSGAWSGRWCLHHASQWPDSDPRAVFHPIPKEVGRI